MPRTHIPSALRRLVIERSHECCEYCLLPRNDAAYSHEIDHIRAVKHKGETVADNLVLACFECNRYKGSDLSAIDPADEVLVSLFNPRTQVWAEHFRLVRALIIGQTPTGRATVDLLRLNSEPRLELRQALIVSRRFPPP